MADSLSPRERRRRVILDAAGALFVERGVPATTMDAIAERAGVSRATVFNHYGEKRELLRALYDRQLDALLSALAAREPARDPLRGIVAFFRTAERVLRGDGPLSPLLVREVLYDPELLTHDTVRGARLRALLVGLVRDGQRQGVLRTGVPASRIAALMMDLWTASLVAWTLEDGRFGLAAHALRKIRLAMRGFGATRAAG